MPRGMSLHVGVNWVDYERHPDGRYQGLIGCDAAAKEMAAIARSRGFVPDLICDPPEATSAEVTRRLRAAAEGKDKARAGDFVLFTFAGHGDELPDADHDEPMDQALVLYDRLLLDDEIYALLERFETGVRVVFVVDCCYGGSIVQFLGASRARAAATTVKSSSPRSKLRFAFLRPPVRADVLLLSACDEQSTVPGAKDGETLPPFTARLLKAWKKRRRSFPGGYVQLKDEIGPPAWLFKGLLRDPLIANQQPFKI